MFLLSHPSLTAINLSYTFPILETSATALCGTTGIYIYWFIYMFCLTYYSNSAGQPRSFANLGVEVAWGSGDLVLRVLFGWIAWSNFHQQKVTFYRQRILCKFTFCWWSFYGWSFFFKFETGAKEFQKFFGCSRQFWEQPWDVGGSPHWFFVLAGPPIGFDFPGDHRIFWEIAIIQQLSTRRTARLINLSRPFQL